MKGLLLKDWFVIWKQGRVMLLLAFLYILITAISGGYFFAALAVIFLSALPITAIGLDERSKWEHYAVMMPYSRKQLVLSKYIFAIAGILAVLVLYIIFVSAVSFLRNQSIDFMNLLYVALALLSLGCAFSAVILPIVFRLGVEKGRMFFFILIILVMLCVGSITPNHGEATTVLTEIINAPGIFYMFIIAIGLIVFSAFLSIKLYERRDF